MLMTMYLVLIVFELNIFQKKNRKFIAYKNIMRIIYRIQAYYSIMCGYLGIGFIDFMEKGKSLLQYRTLFSPNDYEKNGKRILNVFNN